MRCIFCLKDRPATVEHVFPLAIGGSLTTDRVCKCCNDWLGSRADAALSNNLLIRFRRSALELKGNSRRAPMLAEPLLGTWPLASDPEQEVRVIFDKKTGKLKFWTIPKTFNVVLPDGSEALRVIIDASDPSSLATIIKRERKRRDLLPLSPEELEEECRKLKVPENTVTIENPTLHMTLTFDSRIVPQALLKIIYELAFLWMGEGYLDDPKAAELRSAIFADDVALAEKLMNYTSSTSEFPASSLWQPHQAHHLAFSTVVGGGIGICVRVFDIFAGTAVITDDAARYLSGPDPGRKLRFLVMDARDQRQHESALRTEHRRLAHEHVMRRRASVGENDSISGWDWR